MVVNEEEVFRTAALTGTNLQYHLQGDLMVMMIGQQQKRVGEALGRQRSTF